MLAKHQRLNLRKNFQWVASGTKKTFSAGKIFYREGKNEEPLIGVAVSSKVFRSAPERNQAKRVVFSAVQLFYKEIPLSLNIVVLPNNSVLTMNADDLKKELYQVIPHEDTN